MTEATIADGAVSATVSSGDKYGWCGLEALTYADKKLDWQLSPALTLEHYLGVPPNSPEFIQYEPCESPKRLEQVTEEGCTLRYSPMRCSQVECSVDYGARAPHYIDVLVRTNTSRADWPLGYLALFFATIVDAPIYSGITVNGFDEELELSRENPWVSFSGYAGRPGRTIHPAGVGSPELRSPSEDREGYYYDDSSVRFERPFFYGTVDDMVFALLFRAQDRESLRFTVNPVAGAFGGPAWDFFWVIDCPIPNETYELPFRLVWKPFSGKNDILSEYDLYQSHSMRRAR